MVRLSEVPAVSWVIRVTSFPRAVDILVESIRNTSAVREIFLVSDEASDHEAIRTECREKKIRFESVGQKLTSPSTSPSLSNLMTKVTGDYLVLTEGALWLMPQWDEALVQELVQRKTGLISGVLDQQSSARFSPDIFSELGNRAALFLSKNGNRSRRGFEPQLLMLSREIIEAKLTKNGIAFEETFDFEAAILDGVLQLSASGHPLLQAGSCWGVPFANPSQKGPPVHESQLFFEKWARTPAMVKEQLTQNSRSWPTKIRSIFGYI